ncbi:MAG: tetratricopeptide repeat protein [Rhodopirellula sp.]|nr:tetratricopeptide repeat protein [Rhodopirellula sp.]
MKPSMPSWLGGKKDAQASSGQSESVKGLLALARLSERREQKDQAEKVYREVMEKWPKDPAPHHRLAVMRAGEGKFEQAATHFSRALELAPSDAELLSDFGYFCYLQDNIPAAENYLRQAVELDSNNATYCNNLAIVLGEQGRYDEALRLFRRIGSEAEAQANMAFVFARRGEIQRALECYSKALDEDDQLRPAAEGLVQLARFAPQPAQHRTLLDTTSLARREAPRGGQSVAAAEQRPAHASTVYGPDGGVQPADWTGTAPTGAVNFASGTVASPQNAAAPAGGYPQTGGVASLAAGGVPPGQPLLWNNATQAVPQYEAHATDQRPASGGMPSMPSSYHTYRQPANAGTQGNPF